MHEMSLAESMLQIVLDAASAQGAHAVTAVHLELGTLSYVDAAAMQQCFEIVKRGSLADEAHLEVHWTLGEAWCMACAKRVAIVRRGAACPECGSYQLQVARGSEMRVRDIEIV